MKLLWIPLLLLLSFFITTSLAGFSPFIVFGCNAVAGIVAGIISFKMGHEF